MTGNSVAIFQNGYIQMLDQNQTPLLDALKACAERPHAPFYTPGHKRGQGISQKIADVFGKAIFRVDLPELTELDNLFAATGVIQQAQELAAMVLPVELRRQFWLPVVLAIKLFCRAMFILQRSPD
jgi:hypothetical protein